MKYGLNQFVDFIVLDPVRIRIHQILWIRIRSMRINITAGAIRGCHSVLLIKAGPISERWLDDGYAGRIAHRPGRAHRAGH